MYFSAQKDHLRFSLMFVSLPKVLEAMGPLGGVLGMIFFLMVVFAALTSVSILETLAANCMEIFHSTQKKRDGMLLAAS